MSIYMWQGGEKSGAHIANSKRIPVRLIDKSTQSHLYLYIVDPVTGTELGSQWIFAIEKNTGILCINIYAPEIWKQAIQTDSKGRLELHDHYNNLLKYERADEED